ncbi:MAG TPA: FHA domain-containing protein, partial [Gemmatimonadaceae bacterium]|nr:FHA domain-containing protein [Gemmatimonadaceae bacterium]
GGRAPDAVALVSLENQPRAATLTVAVDGTTVLQRITASIVVRLDDETVGVGPIELRHGARIEFGTCRLVFETDAATRADQASRTGERATSSTTEGARVLTLSGSGRSRLGATTPNDARTDPLSGAALVDVRSGARHPLAGRRILIGRDESCDVVVRGNSVSRRHASIAPVVGGFLLRDESANGTLVNGVRVVGTYLLGNGDVVRVQDEELRVELEDATPPVVRGEQTTVLDLARITRGVSEEDARAAANRALVASLEIVRGPFAGACFQLEKAVCSIGRGEENDVRIRDDTVSSAHATLLRKRGAWFVVDLRSMNGTFVDGSRVSGERELHPGARVRLGAVELVFRAIESEVQKPAEPPRPSLWRRFKTLVRIAAPPT